MAAVALRMPSGYVPVEAEEMEYIEGGMKTTTLGTLLDVEIGLVLGVGIGSLASHFAKRAASYGAAAVAYNNVAGLISNAVRCASLCLSTSKKCELLSNITSYASIIVGAIMTMMSPGQAIAQAIDRRDSNPCNGIVWG